ncbi:uncharacterized protein LOC110771145 isoform X3 [Prunus avium]|uniref:Uncharacterized protein LOC110771145 isoform X3 n=1 Tax=Prunus avium TaxID=42229 RepID=A0A6P5TVM6_PRUAV|nr:uncharacterized protein LOC110771145 isoform X3 [Prunus avium]
MELAGGYTAKDQSKVKHLHGGRMGLDSETHLVIKLPDSKLFHDLAGEGLRRKSDKVLIVSPVNVDRILKIGGIVAVPLSNDPSNAFRLKPNYKIVYLRRYASTFVAIRKTGPSYDLAVKSRRLCQFETEAKKTVLNGLEDVVLEPPRRVLAKSNEYLKKIKFLPNLLGDSLQGYDRRVFVNVDLNEDNSGVTEWFQLNYPKMDKEFEVYSLEVEPEEASSTAVAPPRNDVSDWLKKNVREEDYVVMKAEAEMVVEMIKKKTICLVDELFLECNNGWWQKNGKTYGSKRAYWECIALYGRVRDLGVAVHQWFL